MREIKFRAWGKDMGLMFDVFGFDVNHIHGWLRTDKEKINLAIPPHRRDCELMQFTGRKDINGVEIYESDLVKYGNKTLEVIWNPIGSGSWWYAEAGRKHVRRIDLDELEVIGNIYEHPHLLEDKS